MMRLLAAEFKKITGVKWFAAILAVLLFASSLVCFFYVSDGERSAYTPDEAAAIKEFTYTYSNDPDGFSAFRQSCINARGAIMSYREGIVLRPTYHVFDLFVNKLGDKVVDLWHEDPLPSWRVTGKDGAEKTIESLDLLATAWTDREGIALSAVNKHAEKEAEVTLSLPEEGQRVRIFTLNGPDKDSYNDIGRNEVGIAETDLGAFRRGMTVKLPAHSVNIIEIR